MRRASKRRKDKNARAPCARDRQGSVVPVSIAGYNQGGREMHAYDWKMTHKIVHGEYIPLYS